MNRLIIAAIGLTLLLAGCHQQHTNPDKTAAQGDKSPAASIDADKLAEQIADKVAARVEKKMDEKFAQLTKELIFKPAEGIKIDLPAKKVEPPPVKVETKPPVKVEGKVETKPPVKVEAKPPVTVENKPPETTEAAAVDYLSLAGKYKTEMGPSPALGPDEALVKVFIITDFQCPVCRRAAEGLHGLFPEFGDKVQWILWQNPLEMHKKALPCAQASMAAFKQDKFWEYHDLVFANQRQADPASLEGHASSLALDMVRFQADAKDAALLKKIRSDQAAAEKIGARGTPAFVINGRTQVGWGSAAGIGSVVKRELAEMEKLIGGGMELKEALRKRAEVNAKTPVEFQIYLDHFLDGKPAERTADAAK